MTITCQTITVISGPNITATNITVTPATSPCLQPCTVGVSITWTNLGNQDGTFNPNLSVNGTPLATSPWTTDHSLTAGASTTLSTDLTGLTVLNSPYIICPVPN